MRNLAVWLFCFSFGNAHAIEPSQCIEVDRLAGGVHVKNSCNQKLKIVVCVANPKHWWPCSSTGGGLITLAPEDNYPVQDFKMWPGEIRWVACVYPQSPYDWDGSNAKKYHCR